MFIFNPLHQQLFLPSTAFELQVPCSKPCGW